MGGGGDGQDTLCFPQYRCRLSRLAQVWQAGAVLVPTAQMRTLRLRKGTSPAQGHTQVQGGTGIKPGLMQKPEPFFFRFLNFKKVKLLFHSTEFLHAERSQ